jgi:hypothetical protein
VGDAHTYRDLGEAAWTWVLGQVRGDDGPWLPDAVASSAGAARGVGAAGPGPAEAKPAEDRDSLYAGIAGLAPVLAEIRRYREWTGPEQALADAIVARLASLAPGRTEASLYEGLAGDVTALRLLAPGRDEVGLRRLAELATPAGWPTVLQLGDEKPGHVSDVIMGGAGVMLAAAWAGGEHAEAILAAGGEALLGAADRTEAGLDWRMWPGYRSSSPNFSHGTAGVASALAIAGQVLSRDDFIAAARDGARHLLSVGSLDGGGFIVPHTLPYSTRDVEPVTYTWCHGPAGTSLLFAALRRVGVDEVDGHGTGELRERCLHSVLTSGLPARLRPGFWDNDGRCCGTAGVGDVLLDAAQANAAEGGFERYLAGAVTMGDALVERAIRDEAGARWRFIEHRQDPPLLPPATSWMQGAAGIGAFLLRLARVLDEGATAAVVSRPDQWWAVPESTLLFGPGGPA